MTDFRVIEAGLLVSMKTDIRGGNVTYHDIDRDTRVRNNTETTDIHTRKQVRDIAEHERAIKVRTKARGKILSVCSESEFGLMCPNSREADLRQAIAEARELCDEFNKSARHDQISVRVVFGRIAQDDVEAVRAISSEIRGLLDDMRQGVKDLDAAKIRKAANKATDVGKLLTPDMKESAKAAIESARTAAKKIVKAGNQAAVEIDRADLARITKARTMFLDIEAAAAVATAVTPGRAVDFDAEPVELPMRDSMGRRLAV